MLLLEFSNDHVSKDRTTNFDFFALITPHPIDKCPMPYLSLLRNHVTLLVSRIGHIYYADFSL